MTGLDSEQVDAIVASLEAGLRVADSGFGKFSEGRSAAYRHALGTIAGHINYNKEQEK